MESGRSDVTSKFLTLIRTYILYCCSAHHCRCCGLSTEFTGAVVSNPSNRYKAGWESASRTEVRHRQTLTQRRRRRRQPRASMREGSDVPVQEVRKLLVASPGVTVDVAAALPCCNCLQQLDHSFEIPMLLVACNCCSAHRRCCALALARPSPQP